MFHIPKKNVAIRIQVKYLLNVNSLEIIWPSFLLILRKPILVKISLFNLFWHWFLTLSFFLIQETSHSNLFLQITFLGYQKGISLMDVFIILQLSRSVRLRRKWFSGENKERKTTLLQQRQADQIRYLDIFNPLLRNVVKWSDTL